MITRRTLLGAAGAAALPFLPAHAQEWPSRSVRLLVGTAAGGSPDIISRMLGEKFSERLGQSFVIENNTQAPASLPSNSPTSPSLTATPW